MLPQVNWRQPANERRLQSGPVTRSAGIDQSLAVVGASAQKTNGNRRIFQTERSEPKRKVR
jgi:hypothetical protein